MIDIEERGGYRVSLVHDDITAEAPYDYGQTPILKIDSGYRSTATAYNEHVTDRLIQAWNYLVTEYGEDRFERYVRIFHGAEYFASYNTGNYREYGYVAFDTAEWRKELLLSEDVPEQNVAEQSLQEIKAWCEGDVYGYLVERKVTGRKVYDNGSSEEPFEEWEEVDSCYGFYGYDYAEHAAKEALEDAIG